jgi:hypothetical protein
MKLDSFLKESAASFDFDYTEKLRDEVTNELNNVFASMAKHGFKLDEYTEDKDSSDFGVVITNKIFDIVLEIQISPGSSANSEKYDFYWQLAINNAYAVGGGQTYVTSFASGNIARTENTDDLVKGIVIARKRLERVMGPLIDWYFDINGEYGKVKMLVDTRSAENKVRAVAGDFTVNSNSGEVF